MIFSTLDQHLPLRFASHPLFLKHQMGVMPNKHQSLIEPRHMKNFDNSEEPPPLPIKKKHSKFCFIILIRINMKLIKI